MQSTETPAKTYPVMFTQPGDNDQGTPRGADLLRAILALPVEADGYSYASLGPETRAELDRLSSLLAAPSTGTPPDSKTELSRLRWEMLMMLSAMSGVLTPEQVDAVHARKADLMGRPIAGTPPAAAPLSTGEQTPDTDGLEADALIVADWLDAAVTFAVRREPTLPEETRPVARAAKRITEELPRLMAERDRLAGEVERQRTALRDAVGRLQQVATLAQDADQEAIYNVAYVPRETRDLAGQD